MQQIQEELRQFKKQRLKSERREHKHNRIRRNSIMRDFNSLKQRYDSLISTNSKRALGMKQEMIKMEIGRIKAKDSEARRLEKTEERILKRLREAHSLQKDTIHHI